MLESIMGYHAVQQEWYMHAEVIPAWFVVLILVTVGECRTLLYKYMVRSIAEES